MGISKPVYFSEDNNINQYILDIGKPITEKLTNGNFEASDQVVYPTDWAFDSTTDYIYPNSFSISEDGYGTSNALLMTANVAFDGFGYLSAIAKPTAATGAVAGDTVQLKGYIKNHTGSNNIVVFYEYRFGNDGFVYNFTGENQGTWTQVVGAPTTDQMYIVAATSEHAQFTVPVATLPGTDVDDAFPTILSNSLVEGDKLLLSNVEYLINAVDDIENGDFSSTVTEADQTLPAASWNFYNKEFGFFDPQFLTVVENITNGIKLDIYPNEVGQNERTLMGQTITGTPGATVRIKFISYGLKYIVLLDDEIDSFTNGYSFNELTQDWAALEAEKTVDGIRTLPEDYADFAVPLDNVEEGLFDFSIEIPATGKINILVLFPSSDIADISTYVKSFSATTQAASPITDYKKCKSIFIHAKDLDLTDDSAPYDIYSVPEGYVFLPLTLFIAGQQVVGVTVAGEYSIGYNEDSYDNIIAAETDLPNTDKFISINGSDSIPFIDENEDIKLNVTSKFTAGYAIASLYIYGFLIEK